MQKIVENKKNDLKKICSSLGVKRLFVFGSAVTDEFNEDSDIDILISFDENLTFEQYADNYFELNYKLRELFNRPVDIVTERTLSNPYFIEGINETKKLIYEA